MSGPVDQRDARSRGIGRKNALDVLRSLAVVGAGVAAVVLLIPRPEGRIERVVDVAEIARAQQGGAAFDLVVPVVPADWEATSAYLRVEGEDRVLTWHGGYLTADERYAAFEMADEATARWVQEETSGGVEAEQVDVAGTTWQVYRSDDPVRTSLVAEQGDLTTVVTGSATLDDLALLAGAVLDAG